MDHFLVLSALGTDRSGLVAELTRFLVERGANVEESRMVTLGAEFGVMMLISGPGAVCERVALDVEAIEKATGLRILVKPTRDPREQRPSQAIPYEIRVEAIDREGIIHALAEEVRRMGLNIVALETSSFAAPFSGGTLFRLDATVDVPPGKTLRELRERLGALAERENLDIDVKTRLLAWPTRSSIRPSSASWRRSGAAWKCGPAAGPRGSGSPAAAGAPSSSRSTAPTPPATTRGASTGWPTRAPVSP